MINTSVNNNHLSMSTSQQIISAANLLRNGGIVVFPTETVYGLGADVSQTLAIRKIFEIKGRPTNHPLITHFAEIADLEHWADEIPAAAWLLAEHFWPGPLTLILRKSKSVPISVTGGQSTVGLRIPRHPIALALLSELGRHKALAAPSANRFGHTSPTSAKHVTDDFENEISMILDGGSCDVGLESTIVSCIDKTVTILRPGGISVDLIESLLKQKVLIRAHNNSIQTPGSLSAHYAPTTPLEIRPSGEPLWSHAKLLYQQGIRTAIMSWATLPTLPHTKRPHDHEISPYNILMPNDPVAYGKKLYATMRLLDQKGFDRILVEEPPDNLDWLAVTDRLKRASFSTSPTNTEKF